MPKLCSVCHKNPAQVPDRNRMGRPIKRICRECHGSRLTGDLKVVLKEFIEDRKAEFDKTPVIGLRE